MNLSNDEIFWSLSRVINKKKGNCRLFSNSQDNQKQQQNKNLQNIDMFNFILFICFHVYDTRIIILAFIATMFFYTANKEFEPLTVSN